MELLYLPQSWCHIEDANDEPASSSSIETSFVYPAAESPSPTRRPVWDVSPRHHQEQQGEDDYAWYHKHPERYIRRPRRRRLVKSSWQKDEQFKMFNLLLNQCRDSWTDASISETQDSTHSEAWGLLSSSIASSKDTDVSFAKN